MSDELFMQRALELARAARTREEVPIGAVLVRDGAILTEGSNEVEMRQDATAHAEMLAIAEAQSLLKSWRLNGTTLYVTKEPCPMCAGALAHVRVDRIVFGVGDPKAGACGGAFNLFDLPGLNHRCEITKGVLATESLGLLQDFFRERRAESTKRDIDKIIEILTQQFSTLKVVQMDKVHPADDDDLWWFRLPGKTKDIQIESPSGCCPFIVEHSDNKSSSDAVICNTIEEVVKEVAAYLTFLQRES